MIHRSCHFSLVGLIVLFVWALPAVADEVHLTNGDRLTGEILRMENQELLLKTTYAGEVIIKWPEVVCVVSQKDLTVVLKSKEVLIGRATCPSTGVIQVVGDNIGESARLSPADLHAINPSPPPPAITYKGSVTAGGSVTDGNTDSKAVNTSAKFEARSKRHRFTIGAKYNEGETDDKLTARNTTGSFKYDFFVTKKLYSYAQSLFERDDFQDLDLRSTMGLGLGYQIFDSKRASLFGEAGVSYFNEDYELSEDRHYTSGRWSVGFDYQLIPERVKFFHLHEGYYSLEESDSYYIRSEQGFRLPLVYHFLANFQVDYDYNSQPAPGKQKTDTVYIFGLAYEYEF